MGSQPTAQGASTACCLKPNRLRKPVLHATEARTDRPLYAQATLMLARYMCGLGRTYLGYQPGAFQMGCDWPTKQLSAFSKDHQQDIMAALQSGIDLDKQVSRKQACSMRPPVRQLDCAATPSRALPCLSDACLKCLCLSAGVLSPSASECGLLLLCLDAVLCTAVTLHGHELQCLQTADAAVLPFQKPTLAAGSPSSRSLQCQRCSPRSDAGFRIPQPWRMQSQRCSSHGRSVST